jgi:glycosyl-4,4'-diaponeurosporenoate acyltransferase
MKPQTAVLVDAAVWAAWGTAVGWAASRIPTEALATDNIVTRPRAWERSGRAYERLAIRRWKDKLPEAGAVFGGPSKRHISGRAPADLERFAAETRRAELVHWVVPLAVIAFPLWNPWPITAVMVFYAAVANVPFVLVQRYNRARIARVQRQRERMVRC